MKKFTFFAEAAYFVGLLLICIGASFMTIADFGVSTVMAPAYTLYLKLSQIWPWFTLGTSEYALQIALVIIMAIVMRKMNIAYCFCFFTAVFYGKLLDLTRFSMSWIPTGVMWIRVVCYILGLIFSAAGVAFVFNTYLSPEVYEMFVKELSGRFGIKIPVFKTGFDCVFAATAIIMSFVFFGFGKFRGVNVGTVICALVNGSIIGWFSDLYDRIFDFKDGLKLRRYF